MWATSAFCQLNRIPHDAALLIKQFPPPYDVVNLQQALQLFGLNNTLKQTTLNQLSDVSLRCIKAKGNTFFIADGDGQGFISIDNTPANSGTLKLDNIYKNESTGYTFTKLNGGTSIVISKAGDANRIIINDWSETNNLSINLTDTAPAAPQITLMGDFKKKIDKRGTADTSDDIYIIENNNYVNEGIELGALDLLYGDAGNNVIDGGRGDDYITGEAGDDYLIGGEGNDLIQGGLGSDTIFGGAGNDTLYAVTKLRHNKENNVDYAHANPTYQHINAVKSNR